MHFTISLTCCVLLCLTAKSGSDTPGSYICNVTSDAMLIEMWLHPEDWRYICLYFCFCVYICTPVNLKCSSLSSVLSVYVFTVPPTVNSKEKSRRTDRYPMTFHSQTMNVLNNKKTESCRWLWFDCLQAAVKLKHKSYKNVLVETVSSTLVGCIKTLFSRMISFSHISYVLVLCLNDYVH